MKRIRVPFLAALSLGGALALSVALFAQQQSQQQQTKAPNNSMYQTSTQQRVKTFTGTVVKKGDALVLKVDSSKKTYSLDDQQKVEPFEGKSVKVTGTLDAATNTITIQTIEPA